MRGGRELDWAYLVATFHLTGIEPVRVKRRTGGGAAATPRFANKQKLNFKEKNSLETRYSMMSFLLFLLPVLGQTLSNTIILDTESESDAFVLERVKRGFYT